MAKETNKEAKNSEIVLDKEGETVNLPEPISFNNDEALTLANNEIARITAEFEQMAANFETAKNLVEELSEKIKDIEAKEPVLNNLEFIKFLDDMEVSLEHYAGRRTERLRKEFVTDLKELIQKTRESLK